MHCPENLNGFEYVELVAAVSIILSQNQSAFNTFLLSEFLNDVSHQLFVLAAFNEAKENRDKNKKRNGKGTINIII